MLAVEAGAGATELKADAALTRLQAARTSGSVIFVVMVGSCSCECTMRSEGDANMDLHLPVQRFFCASESVELPVARRTVKKTEWRGALTLLRV